MAFYFRSLHDKIIEEERKWTLKLIKHVASFKYSEKSQSRENWKILVAKLTEMEIHLKGFFKAAEDIKSINSNLYYDLMDEFNRPDTE